METLLLDQSAYESLGQLIKEQLKNTKFHLRRIDKQEGGEPLHDFRVALRRLRIWVRVAGQEKDLVVRKRDRNRLKRLVQLTNEARDLEVRLSLLRQHLTIAEVDDEIALDLQRKWKAQIDKDYKRLLNAAGKDLKKAEPGIKELLSRIRKMSRVSKAELGFRDWLNPILMHYAEKTDAALSQIKSSDDKEQSHKARLLAKALRYLIEPLSNELPQINSVFNSLRRVQDLIGGLRDAQMLALELDKTIQKSQKSKKIQALKNARERNSREIDYLYDELRRSFLGRTGPHFRNKIGYLFKTAKIQ